ncbi:MAG: DEAD/DEAH box helicase family protein [Candidatus Diapherotrites archaeon]|nr:DEAD/DEAH box helicase family protein [Candidatus Diapherotrites archaeon]
MKFVSSKLIKENLIEEREYQVSLVDSVLSKGNTLIVAPTALGKTVIAVLLTAKVLEKNPERKILFLAPTKPLAVQHQKSFKQFTLIPEEEIVLLTGTTLPEKRVNAWNKAKIICATPQTIENDLMHGRISLKETGLIIFDEAHRAVKDYAYPFIAKQYIKQEKNPLILGLTASPGSENERIQDVNRNLFISNIEVKSLSDKDIMPYSNEIEIEWKSIILPTEFLEIKKSLNEFISKQLIALKKIGLTNTINPQMIGRKKLLEIQYKIRKELTSEKITKPSYFIAASRTAALIKLSHAVDLLETQGISPLKNYFDSMQKETEKSKASKASLMLMNSEEVQNAIKLTEKAFNAKLMHPKLMELKKILKEQFSNNPESRVLVFNHFRDSIKFLEEYLKEEKIIKAAPFIGQANKESGKGMKQKEQIQLLQEFKEGKYNTLLCSSVAEEGLDIPAVDLVVFFEAVPSEIRFIQRRGRTGRFHKGKTIILIAKNTRDEAYYWSSIAKEKRMHSTLREIKNKKENVLPKQTTLTKYTEEIKNKIEIYVDARERNSKVSELLEEMGCLIKVKQMEIGDYILSDDVVVERKTVEDFLTSLLDGRLFSQAIKMNENYSMPLYLVEGRMEDLFNLRNIHKNALIGALTSLALNYRTSVFFVSGAKETAEFLYVIAKREQFKEDKEIRLRIGRKGITSAEQQRFIVESFPMIGPQAAINLLKEFKSVKNIVNATEKELQKTELLGKKKAETIKKLLEKEYKEE